MNYCPVTIGPSQTWTCKPSLTRRKCCQHKKSKSSLTYEQLQNMKYHTNGMPWGNHKACLPQISLLRTLPGTFPWVTGSSQLQPFHFSKPTTAKELQNFTGRDQTNKNKQNKISFCGKKNKRKTKAKSRGLYQHPHKEVNSCPWKGDGLCEDSMEKLLLVGNDTSPKSSEMHSKWLLGSKSGQDRSPSAFWDSFCLNWTGPSAHRPSVISPPHQTTTRCT